MTSNMKTTSNMNRALNLKTTWKQGQPQKTLNIRTKATSNLKIISIVKMTSNMKISWNRPCQTKPTKSSKATNQSTINKFISHIGKSKPCKSIRVRRILSKPDKSKFAMSLAQLSPILYFWIIMILFFYHYFLLLLFFIFYFFNSEIQRLCDLFLGKPM